MHVMTHEMYLIRASTYTPNSRQTSYAARTYILSTPTPHRHLTRSPSLAIHNNGGAGESPAGQPSERRRPGRKGGQQAEGDPRLRQRVRERVEEAVAHCRARHLHGDMPVLARRPHPDLRGPGRGAGARRSLCRELGCRRPRLWCHGKLVIEGHLFMFFHP